jgi:hypothetical protein
LHLARTHLAILNSCLLLGVAVSAVSQTQTTRRITGTVKDSQGAVVAGGTVTIENPATGDKYSVETDGSGNYSVLQVPSARYAVTIRAPGFMAAQFENIAVGMAETVTVNATLQVGTGSETVMVGDVPPLVRTDSAELSSRLDSHSLEALPLPTRNFLQLLTLAPGVSAPLTNNNAIGRNSPNVSVNGLRVNQNNYRINGVDAGDVSLHVFADVAVPAPESVSEVNVQTSLYDASVAGGGGNVQVVTKSGSNALHGSVYEYFRNEAFNANDANLKSAGQGRPLMRRNVYGAALGGPLRKDQTFFFASYQGTRETNGATDQSLYKDVLVASGLTSDRSAATLMSTFGVPSIDPISLKLLNSRLPNGEFLIPTPHSSDGLVTGTALSIYHEEQFNTNVNYRAGPRDLISGKFFLAHAPLFSALSGSNFGTPSSLPGFGTHIHVDNRVLSVEEIHTFSPAAVNEARFGYAFLRHDEVPQESLPDTAIGMQRSTAAQYPGLPLILLGRDEGAGSIGTSDITYTGHNPSLSFADTLSLQRGRHNIRLGGEIQHSEWHARVAVFSYGEIDFPTFRDFLAGNTGVSPYLGTSGFAHLGTGLTDRDTISANYHLFVQDDWKVSAKLTVNFGLRYELDLPPYDSRGRIGGFDPALYQPRLQVDADGFPVGPPAMGVVEAGNGPPQYSLPGVLRVGKRIVKSVDPNNFGPRIGLAWSPLNSGRLAVRTGYGVFYSRSSLSYLALGYFAPPFFQDSDTSGQPFSAPFATAPPDSSFPLVQAGNSVAAVVVDRNARTPYVQQFNASVQYEFQNRTTMQIGYVGSRGVKLFRGVNVNQARIASLDHPIVNAVTGQTITDNTNENAALRAPLQGISTAFFALNESAAQSTYHSLQATLSRSFTRGLQFSASYTFSRSIDNASNPGGGANNDGTVDRSGGLDTGNVWGNQFGAHANRGLSDFDRTHYFVLSSVLTLPEPAFVRASRVRQLAFSNWQVSGIVTAMSGLPVDVFDPTGGSLYGLAGGRPSWALGGNRASAMSHVPSGYYFNASAFTEAMVQPGQRIPSAQDPTALAGDLGTDIGNVGRNLLRGPSQSNIDCSVGKRFPVSESRGIEFRADLFNVLNHSNRDNPVSNIGSTDFGKVLTFSSSPRIVQLALKLVF